jgi:hypothetical protein
MVAAATFWFIERIDGLGLTSTSNEIPLYPWVTRARSWSMLCTCLESWKTQQRFGFGYLEPLVSKTWSVEIVL